MVTLQDQLEAWCKRNYFYTSRVSHSSKLKSTQKAGELHDRTNQERSYYNDRGSENAGLPCGNSKQIL